MVLTPNEYNTIDYYNLQSSLRFRIPNDYAKLFPIFPLTFVPPIVDYKNTIKFYSYEIKNVV